MTRPYYSRDLFIRSKRIIQGESVPINWTRYGFDPAATIEITDELRARGQAFIAARLAVDIEDGLEALSDDLAAQRAYLARLGASLGVAEAQWLP